MDTFMIEFLNSQNDPSISIWKKNNISWTHFFKKNKSLLFFVIFLFFFLVWDGILPQIVQLAAVKTKSGTELNSYIMQTFPMTDGAEKVTEMIVSNSGMTVAGNLTKQLLLFWTLYPYLGKLIQNSPHTHKCTLCQLFLVRPMRHVMHKLMSKLSQNLWFGWFSNVSF